jgi:hypothetical protein
VCNIMIVFSKTVSIAIYLLSITFAILFAYFAQKYSNKGVNRVFWTISFLLLWIPVAFRASGVDHISYLNHFRQVQIYGSEYFKVYSGSPEPLYALLVYLVASTSDKFQYIYIISSFIALFFTYLGFAKMVKRTSLPLTVMWFAVTYYMTFYGLVRMSLAVGIITYAFHFIEQSKMLKYFFFCTIAALFHYSAAFMFIMYFLLRRKQKLEKAENYRIQLASLEVQKTRNINVVNCLPAKKRRASKRLSTNIVLVGVAFYGTYKSVPYLFGGFSWFARYMQYFNFRPTLSVINNLAGFFLLFLLLLMWQNRIKIIMKEGRLYITSIWIMLAIGVFSVIFPVVRLSYYLMPMGCYLYGFLPKVTEKRLRVLIYFIYLVVGGTWWYYAYMMPGHWGDNILPYEMKFRF